MQQDLESYYNERALQYDKLYLNPEEQNDLVKATEIIQAIFRQKTVLEIACGTGYWTKRIAKSAKRVYATDINAAMLEIAREKRPGKNINYAVADMYNFSPEEKYESLFAGFVWNHILVQEVGKFMASIKRLSQAGGEIVFIDCHYREEVNQEKREVAKTDEYGNTYQLRTLENGTEYLVLKNFPTKDFICTKMEGIATEINYLQLDYYWIVICKLRG